LDEFLQGAWFYFRTFLEYPGIPAVNILAVPSQHRGRVFLPFAGDDPRTAEVMSKIILLAEDQTIKDPAILSQIG
jgi:hypothetical protein